MKLSTSQVNGIMAMGDMGIKGKFGVWVAWPPVNGRSLTVLERERLVERRDTDGMWRLTIAGVAEYQRLCGEACTAMAAECAAKMAADDLAAAERLAEVAGTLTGGPVTDHGFSGHSRRPMECRMCGRHAAQHSAFVPGDGSSEAMWRRAHLVASEPAESVGTPWKARNGKYGKHSKARRG